MYILPSLYLPRITFLHLDYIIIHTENLFVFTYFKIFRRIASDPPGNISFALVKIRQAEADGSSLYALVI